MNIIIVLIAVLNNYQYYSETKNVSSPLIHSNNVLLRSLLMHASVIRTLFLILLLQYCPSQSASGKEIKVLLLYTKSETPYQKAYDQIIGGIRSYNTYDLKILSLANNYNLTEVQNWIDENTQAAKHLIILGNRAHKVSKLLRLNELEVVTGALDILPGKDQTPGISIRVHPAVYLEHLRLLSPNSKKLIMFYNNKDEALVPIVKSEARKLDIAVTPIPVVNATGAIRDIASIIETIDPTDTAIWFTRNVIELNNEVLYPYILEESWNRHIPVFSGMISHTKRGFLFSLYPDYQGIGLELARIIMDHTQANTAMTIHFSKAVKFAVNIRTLQHLGILPYDRIFKRVDLKFPAWKSTN